ncbi:MAG: Ig-like domain-containing protein [Candidatus Thorarchaeota archaeon]
MKTKHAIVFAMVLVMFGATFFVPSVITPTSADSGVLSNPLQDETLSPAADNGLEELKYNVNQNPSFETMDSVNNWPDTYSGFATAFRTSDPAYTTDTNSGTYAGYIASHGVPRGGTSQAYFSRSFGQNPTPVLSSSLTLDFYWNTLANPDIDQGSYLYILIQTTNVTGNYHEIRYYLSNTYFSTSNTTSLTCFLWNFPTDSWNHFSRDLSVDYAANPLNSPADSTRRVQEVYWYASSGSVCDDKLEVLLDDVTLSNGTYSGWVPNGDFETGNGQYWGYNFGTPTFVTQSTESTDGTYSLNMTTGVVVSSSNAYGGVEKDFQYPAGVYCNEPGETVVEFDWKFSSVSSLMNQFSYLGVTFTNESGSFFLRFVLGFGADTISGFVNSSTTINFVLDEFNMRDIWHGIQLDMYDYISEFGSTVGTITEFEFYLYASDVGAQVSLLVDDFLIFSSPTGDPSFELDWYSSSYTPFAAWVRGSGDITTIQQTTDSYSGTYACNLTPATTDNNLAAVSHSTFVDIGPSDYLDFWWKLNAMNDVSNSRAYVSLTFESGKILYYLLGSSDSYAPANTTTVGFILVDDFNSTGIWNNLHRNITQDAEEIFGSEDWQITVVTAVANFYYSGMYESSVSLIVDDIIITDGAPPVIDSVIQVTTTPMYYDHVHIQIGATDTRPGIDHVMVNYTIDGGSIWQSVLATGGYDAYIPTQDYGITVEYSVIAVDGVGLEGIDDNGGAFYSYTVGDDIDPTLSIDTPAHLSDVEGVVEITTTVNDAGSGVDYVQFIVDSGAPINDDTAPYSYDWNTDDVTLGQHDIDVIVHDLAGNTQSDTIDVTVVDTIHPIVDEPPDFEFVEGWIDQVITWQVSDLRPDSFEILVDGSQIHSGPWTLSSTTIEITVDTIGQGVHNVTLVVIDAGGNSASDTVFVTITPHVFTETDPPTTTTNDTTTSSESGDGDTTPLVIIAVVGVGGILIVVFVVLPVLKKK